MTYKIAFKKSVARDLKKIDRVHVMKLMERIEKVLSKNAAEFPELKGQFTGLRKCRIGDYRVIFTIIDDTVLIARIKHRKEAYK